MTTDQPDPSGVLRSADPDTPLHELADEIRSSTIETNAAADRRVLAIARRHAPLDIGGLREHSGLSKDEARRCLWRLWKLGKLRRVPGGYELEAPRELSE